MINRVTVVLVLFLGGCASSPPSLSEVQSQSLMLVSMEDGSIVIQTAPVDAEICWKTSTESETNCFKKGEAIVDPQTQQVVAYEAEQTTVHLVGR